jgi:biopolymer transport protein ExbD
MLIRRHDQDEEGLDVDLSPLIDVTFLLLIFFVLTTSFSQEEHLHIERPTANSGEEGSVEPIRVALDAEGLAYIDGARVAPWLLQGRLEARIRDNQAREVLLIADERVPSGRMIEVVDQCRLAGAENVAVSTRGGRP